MPLFLKRRPYSYNHTLNIPYFEEGLQFDSAFENANLKKAIRVSSTEYKLILEQDYNTKGHTHWFYFKTKSSLKPGTEVKFSILNHSRNTALYNKGLKPCTLNMNDSHHIWQFNTFNVKFFQNSIQKMDIDNIESEQKHYYTLEFNYKFSKGNEEVYFAQSYPYTYLDLINYLEKIRSDERLSKYVQVNLFCKSLASNLCPVITITDNVGSFYDKDVTFSYLKRSKNTKKIILQKAEKTRKQFYFKTKNSYSINKKLRRECHEDEIKNYIEEAYRKAHPLDS